MVKLQESQIYTYRANTQPILMNYENEYLWAKISSKVQTNLKNIQVKQRRGKVLWTYVSPSVPLVIKKICLYQR